ncbi:Fic family protein [Demequina lutea]|uniref:Fic family protein n=1 Tax=Demequina lutea TaxID=431489 RepID=UPI0009FD4B1F
MVTDGTLDHPEYAGRLQDDERERVSVGGDGDQLLHRPPPVTELPQRLDALCAFANGEGDAPYMPKVLRAITIHFMMGYDHYFEDGMGARRALCSIGRCCARGTGSPSTSRSPGSCARHRPNTRSHS